MPVISLDRLPLPNLKIYTSISVAALSACIYFSIQINTNPTFNLYGYNGNNKFEQYNKTNSSDGDERSLGQFITDVFSVMIREPICVWTMINMAFCWLILVGTAIQKLVFGELRVSEQQHLKDKFWNFVFYKFIFVFGIINVQYIDEVLLWCSWFSLLGFLHLLSQLSKDRFEYLSFSPTTPIWNHIKLLVLLCAILALSSFMLLVSVFVGFFGGFNTFAFMSAEVILLSVRTLHVIIRYGLHLYDVKNENTTLKSDEENKVWEKRGPIVYYIELGFELSALIIDFIHHLHMLVWSNIFLSMASLVICMQLRYLFHEIQRRYKKHRNYLWVRTHLEQNYPMASVEELAENCDNCAICWEKMDSARKLPCDHLFHNVCLLSWLEQDTSCPTCRLGLNIQNPSNNRIDIVDLESDTPQPVRRQLNHFFHFDGSRYVSWLPSFSVEVSHAQLMRVGNVLASNSQLDAMGRQVQQLFPHLPLNVIIADLRITRSVELTIENVLDGRLIVPTMYRDTDTTESTITTTAVTTTTTTPPLSPTTTATTAAVATTTTTTTKLMETFQSEPTSSMINAQDWDNYDINEMEDTTTLLGGRFSKSPHEREKILQKRKENLLQKARKKYIQKKKFAAAAASK